MIEALLVSLDAFILYQGWRVWDKSTWDILHMFDLCSFGEFYAKILMSVQEKLNAKEEE